jgi:hypothetical protein
VPLVGEMLNEANARMTETFRSEQRAKDTWNSKYAHKFPSGEVEDEAADMLAAAESSVPRVRSEMDATISRLRAFEGDQESPAGTGKEFGYESMRRHVAATVRSQKTRSHLLTGDVSTPSMLNGIGPVLWNSITPGGAPHIPTPRHCAPYMSHMMPMRI